MSRKRNETGKEKPSKVSQDSVPETIPLESSSVSETTASPNTEGTANDGDKKKPIVAYRLSSDRTTSIELSVWANTYVNRETNEEYEQLSVTLSRSYKEENGAWSKGGSWRIHYLPCLLFLLQKAHAFALNRRTGDTSIPF